MANSDINKREFSLVGQIDRAEGVIKLLHFQPLRRLLKHLDEKMLEVNIKPVRYQRSQAQNRWLWGVAYVRVARWFKESFGFSISKDEIHEYSKQHIIKSTEYDTVAFEKDEFRTLVGEIVQLSEAGNSQEDILKMVNKNIRHWTVNVQLKEVMGHRTVTSPETKTTSQMNTVEFGEFKDKLQAYYAEKGCDIPDPRENNFITDFIEDE